MVTVKLKQWRQNLGVGSTQYAYPIRHVYYYHTSVQTLYDSASRQWIPGYSFHSVRQIAISL